MNAMIPRCHNHYGGMEYFYESGSFLVPGGGLFIKKSELARLGLRRQRMGVIEPYAVD